MQEKQMFRQTGRQTKRPLGAVQQTQGESKRSENMQQTFFVSFVLFFFYRRDTIVFTPQVNITLNALDENVSFFMFFPDPNDPRPVSLSLKNILYILFS